MMKCTPESGHCQSICTLSSVITMVVYHKREFYTSLAQLSQLIGVARPARQAIHRMGTVPAFCRLAGLYGSSAEAGLADY
jgi:hypothetical protein